MKPELAETLNLSHLILDTGVFIHASHESEIREFLAECAAISCVLVTILPVELELIKGASNLLQAKKSQTFLKQIIQYTLPLEQQSLANALKLSLVYGSDGREVSPTDFLLAGVLMRYQSGRTFLMSPDISAFPTDIFDMVDILQIFKRKQILNFGIYKFSESKYTKKSDALLKNAPRRSQ